MFFVYFLPVTVVPILICAGVMWWLRGIPNTWNVIWRGTLIVPITYFIVSELPFFNSSYYEMMDGYVVALCKAFLVAAIPEEMCKLATLYYVVWRVYKWKPNKFSDALQCSMIIGTAFSVTENIVFSGMGLMRILAFFGHFSYAVIMGYCFSLLHFSNVQKHRWLVYVAMIGLPILCHGIWDSIGYSVLTPFPEEFSDLVFLVGIGLPIFLMIAVYKLLRNAKRFDSVCIQ